MQSLQRATNKVSDAWQCQVDTTALKDEKILIYLGFQDP